MTTGRMCKDKAGIVRIGTIIALLGLGITGSTLWAQAPSETPRPLAPLKTVAVPQPANLREFVNVDGTGKPVLAAIQLGKALFWDMQVGSDGVQACASCHFHAGADNRRKNQISPGLLGGDTTFQLGGPNYTLQPTDFPTSTNDVVSSQGVFNREFVNVNPGSAVDICNDIADAVFHVNGIHTRRVEPRNAPTVINAVFNFDNFWDGRADQDFNGFSPFGPRDPNAPVIWRNTMTGLEQVRVVIFPGSLASQADGPPGSPFEMSCAGRIFPKIGKKMLAAGIVPLGQQFVDRTDSVLGPIARSGSGLTVDYRTLIQQAFRSEWWSDQIIPTGTFTQMQANFSLFFGLSVQLYEATLVANDTRVDRFLGGNTSALDPVEQAGRDLFVGRGQCIACHDGAELTNASVGSIEQRGRLRRVQTADGGCGVADRGFANIGVRPTAEDISRGGIDPFGNPLSDTRMAFLGKFFDPKLQPPLGQVPGCDSRAVVDGAAKVASLRTVELTGPYFHNGGKGTLAEVTEFYHARGDFAAQNVANVEAVMNQINISGAELAQLVAFLQALTDERVRQEKAPFDHPAIRVPNGCSGDQTQVVGASGSPCRDDLVQVPAVGGGGRPTAGLLPLQPFLSVINLRGGGQLGSGNDTAQFSFEFLLNGSVPSLKLRFEDRGRGIVVLSNAVDRFLTTETCAQVWGLAQVNGTNGFAFTAKACDNGQGGGFFRDFFHITVPGIPYTREGNLTGGNLQASVR
jgi:cytochrome c peroxidase